MYLYSLQIKVNLNKKKFSLTADEWLSCQRETSERKKCYVRLTVEYTPKQQATSLTTVFCGLGYSLMAMYIFCGLFKVAFVEQWDSSVGLLIDDKFERIWREAS
jgi:hypothetical protein